LSVGKRRKGACASSSPSDGRRVENERPGVILRVYQPHQLGPLSRRNAHRILLGARDVSERAQQRRSRRSRRQSEEACIHLSPVACEPGLFNSQPAACQATGPSKLEHLARRQEVAILRQLGPSLVAQMLILSGCTASNAKPMPPQAAARPRRDCSVAAPCDGIRQWFANEARDAELTAAYCDPPSPGKAGDCHGLEGAIAHLHRLNLDDFSDLCARLSGKPSAEIYPFVWKADRDETAPCGATQCRVWIWYWFAGGRWGIFTILFKLPLDSSEWLLQRCNYCGPNDCRDMPPL
jgi:hypothetical protein